MKKIGLFIVVITVVAIFASCGFSQGITGNIYDSIYGTKITKDSGVTIILKSLDNTRVPEIEIIPSKNGTYKIEAKPGRYRIETDDPDLNYKRFIQAVEIGEGVMEFDIPTEPIVKTWIHGLVAEVQPGKTAEEDYKTLIGGAVIEIDGKTSVTDENGNFEIKYIKSGLKKVSIIADGYKPYNKAYNLSKGETIEYFELEPVIDKDQSLVSSVTNLISFKAEILKGSSSKNISDSYMTTLITMPYTLEVENSGNKYRLNMGELHLFDEATKEFTKSEDPDSEVIDFVKSSFELLTDVGRFVSNSTDMKIGATIGNLSGYSCSPYNFKYIDDENGFEYDATLWVITDGKLETYPIKLTLFDESKNEYLEINLFGFNSPENNEILN
ncbi:MAG: hypothetical protein R2883_07485 [Caldisericia bacterium]